MAKSSGGSGRGGGGGSGGGSNDNSISARDKLLRNEPREFTKEIWVGDDRLLVKVETDTESLNVISPPPYIQDVLIMVNRTVEDGTVGDEKQQLRIALKAKTIFKEYATQSKDGTILSNTPYDFDGKGAARRSLYEKAGFSAKGKTMYAMVKNGKLIPITERQINSMKKTEKFR